ncbi:L,D-transpeptidase family protein [Chelatococcus daeguensis]|uniref:L,D-transpeptidase family protein n=1 Tax=Chelatococcus daeguensis TaxID=444444 RepID=UPI0007AB4815|nr:L,D-transpeptidase family protein [Chelatococcus daeguensis]KZE34675.1 L,D-transpeptidase catalytic domain protein [Chelatococcus daeguensis]MBM3082507.1 L,D-transpeptidase family protein [Chelatococcus daeguensis]
MKRTFLRTVRVLPRPLAASRGLVVAGHVVLPCALGKGGVARLKREGDGATPLGRFALGALYLRTDKGARPRSGLPARRTRPDDGWCDAPGDRRYNRPVRLPYPASHERMWREDDVYDRVLDIRYNRGPIRPGRGSAIFMHLARPGFAPTAGCVALRRADLDRLLPRLGPRTLLVIGNDPRRSCPTRKQKR